jgi:predicted nucleic acid-binding protein
LNKREGPRELVLDTSVVVKFHVPEEQHEEARALRTAFEEGRVELLAPGTILPEAFNAFWQLHRRGELSREEVREGWDLISNLPLSLYAPEDLMPRAVQLTFETGVIVYDALFLALAEDAETVMVTADGKLLKAIEGTLYARLAHHLVGVDSLVTGTG